MPTGYTAAVNDGTVTDLKDYAAGCARGFGAFLHMRDDGNVALRYPKKDDFYERWLSDAVTERERWKGLSEEQRYAEWSDYAKARAVERHERLAEDATVRARYESMLAQVESVDVPSALANFKNFMVEQLTSSIDFDCHGDDEFFSRWYSVKPYFEWCDDKTRECFEKVARYEAEVRKNDERHAEQVAFIDLMVETFGFEVEPSE